MRAIEAGKKAEKRSELIRQQQESGVSVTAFCREHGFSGQTFYNWRKRLAGSEAVKFALVAADSTVAAAQIHVELLLVSGDRLRIAPGADATTLRTVLNVLRETRMMHLPASVRVYLCDSACDMRKSFDGLHALVTKSMELDAFAGHLFVFGNRRRDRIKILYRDRDGFAVSAKRLEEGACGDRSRSGSRRLVRAVRRSTL